MSHPSPQAAGGVPTGSSVAGPPPGHPGMVPPPPAPTWAAPPPGYPGPTPPAPPAGTAWPAPPSPGTAPTPQGPPAPGAPLPAALRAARQILGAIWHGNPVAALSTASEHTRRSLLLWWVVVLANGLAAGMLAASFVAKSARGAATVTNNIVDPFDIGYARSSVSSAFAVPFSSLAAVALVTMLAVATTTVLRTLTVTWTFGVRGARGRFRDAAAIVATAGSPVPLLLTAAWLLSLVPGAGGVLLSLPVVAVGGLGLLVVSEALVYIGLNRAERFSKSPLVPHAALTVAHGALSTVVLGLLNLVVLASLFG